MYEQFSDSARIVMQLAEQEARRLRHEYIGTEDLLLGIVKEESGVAGKILSDLFVDARVIAHEVERILQMGPDPIATEKLTLTPRGKNVILFAMEEARGLHHDYVGTPHLLLGLRREEGGVAAQILVMYGVELETLRQETAKRLVCRE
jgi:ATP-dependent Clp protease ATP-binding subunit ClpC